ncbi:hypothetical protein LJK87_46660 [Paenibacillus sp. P25]|nr:hypothetical protein LJK87_46660 [Paenibacillus sp. P25]
MLQQLVRIPSIQGKEQPAQALVADQLRSMGMDVEVWEPDGRELAASSYFYSPRSCFEGSPNVVGVLKGSGGGRSILLNGHIDVVPEGAPSSGRVTRTAAGWRTAGCTGAGRRI